MITFVVYRSSQSLLDKISSSKLRVPRGRQAVLLEPVRSGCFLRLSSVTVIGGKTIDPYIAPILILNCFFACLIISTVTQR